MNHLTIVLTKGSILFLSETQESVEPNDLKKDVRTTEFVSDQVWLIVLVMRILDLFGLLGHKDQKGSESLEGG